MDNLIFSILTQSITFLPLALAISISYYILRATDLTIDGSFVIGASVFSRMVTVGISPIWAILAAMLCGALSGMLTATIQRNNRVDPLLAGVLATFILSSINLIIMGKPNISLLDQTTLFSSAFSYNETLGWGLVALASFLVCSMAILIIRSRLGLALRAFGDNPILLQQLGTPIELVRLFGFSLTNLLAAFAGCITAQTIGFADINMGFGMTLTGIGAVILGSQIIQRIFKPYRFQVSLKIFSCLLGVVLYFSFLNLLMKFDFNPLYLKMMLGLIIIFFLRTAIQFNDRTNQI
jgi:putative ABC transport system permease protein